ncbi:MAG: AraC family transcriptional regulator [Bacteroidota bacterium]|nr:AraC family transcriptional regulator [Bacteroidota bacterium]
MISAQNILSLAINHPVMQEEMELLHHKKQNIPGSVHYVINRYRKMPNVIFEDTGMMVYNYDRENKKSGSLELVFCIAGNKYCKQKKEECNFCKHSQSHNCDEIVETMDVAGFLFSSCHLKQFVKELKTTSFSENVLNFRHTSSFSKTLPLCSRTRSVLDALLNHNYSESLENIFINAQMQMLLLYSMECIAGESEDSFSCKFLSNEADREKISLAREILLQHIGEPLTIKELSRKAAINECYLKKGFKDMYGTTIFDFFQSQRMEHAKYLLYEKGFTVTDVSFSLGYSSISHFSTAFKKHTGLKPCELLFR